MTLFNYLKENSISTNLKESIENSEYTSQLEALALLINGQNVFISGPAGSGKSHLIRTYINFIKNFINENSIYVTSTTGITALNIDGITLHSLSGRNPNIFENFEEIYNNKKAQKRNSSFFSSKLMQEKAAIVVIDEISMMSQYELKYLLDALKHHNPNFENIQFIVCGDFSQLKPVSPKKSKHPIDYQIKSNRLCYNTEEWNELNFTTVYLDKIYRTKDKPFQDMLNEISLGIVTPETIKLLNSRVAKENSDTLILYAKNDYVTSRNNI